MVHEAATTGFARDPERYHRSRPTYHPGVARRVVDRYGQGVLVELGAGTGIFTRQLVDLGRHVIAVEPVVTMRTKLAEAVPEAEVRAALDPSVKRLGEPSEIASIIAWLASEEGGYATGADFSVNGGLHMG